MVFNCRMTISFYRHGKLRKKNPLLNSIKQKIEENEDKRSSLVVGSGRMRKFGIMVACY